MRLRRTQGLSQGYVAGGSACVQTPSQHRREPRRSSKRLLLGAPSGTTMLKKFDKKDEESGEGAQA